MKFVFKTLFLVLFSFGLLFPQTKQPVKEVRAVWVSVTVDGSAVDWPTTSGAVNQQNEAIRILDQLKENNFNTIVLQVRARGDLLYPSKIEPWSKTVTGTLGRNPGYDPLQFWIDETHKRGMELHAWWNFAYVATGTTVPTSVGLPHIGTTNPIWVRRAGSNMYMDVGLPEVREYLVSTAMEMVNNYDIDAIHFDFIRYLENIGSNWDTGTFRANNSEGMTLADWRRENINKFVRAIHDNIKAVKPWVKVGSTPIGNYASGVPGVGAALYGYSDVFCDSRRWLREGKHDYLAPQIYWAMTGAYPFNRILADWLANSSGRHIWGGVASYKDEPNNANNNVYNQTAQIIQNSRDQNSAGNIFFRLRQNLNRNNYESIKSSYLYPANIPAMPWLNSIPPAIPENLTITKIDDKTFQLKWDRAKPGTDGDTAKYYNIYRSISPEIDYADGANLYHITPNSDNLFTMSFAEPPEENYYFTVTALDRGNVESAPSNMVQSTEAVEAPVVATNSNIDFNNVSVSSSGDIRSLKITNAGSTELEISGLEFTGENADLFSFNPIPDLPLTIAPSESVDLQVQFTSDNSLGIKTATIVIEHNVSGQFSEIITLRANSVLPVPIIDINLLTLTFGNVGVGNSLQKHVRITNNGYDDLVISSISINGSGFILPNNEDTIIVQRNNSYDLMVRFLPSATIDYSSSITLTHNADGSPSSIQLNGKGITPISADDLEKPTEFKLDQNYPNPFNPTTNIAYHIPSRANVKLSVYNILGQEVSVLVNEIKNAGNYIVKFDASNLSTGVYIYKIHVSTGNKTFVDNKKMLLMK